MGKNIIEKKDHGVRVLTLNRPEIRNALSSEMIADILANLKTIQSDQDARVLIITGAGSAFCAGGDIQEMVQKQGMFGGTSIEIYNHYRKEIQMMVRSLYHLEIPTIAAVNGPAIGAGCDFAAFCDIRIASKNAIFAESFVHLGLLSGDGGNWILPRIIGLPRATEMAFMGDPVSAEMALEIGLVSSLSDPGELLTAALKIAQKIGALPSSAVRMTKKLLHKSLESSLGLALDEAASMQALLHGTEDHKNAVAALLSHLHKK